jgi:hypothetical protein
METPAEPFDDQLTLIAWLPGRALMLHVVVDFFTEHLVTRRPTRFCMRAVEAAVALEPARAFTAVCSGVPWYHWIPA